MDLRFFSAVFVIVVTSYTGAEQLSCDTGWSYQGGDKCYKVFHGEHARTYHRAKDLCKNYGSRLVTIKDQYENDMLGKMADQMSGRPGEQYYIGLSLEQGNCDQTCKDLRWSNGELASNHLGFWADNQPNEEMGDCVYMAKNTVNYVYDRPYVFGYGNCYMKKAFICERMASPTDSFHCWQGGYARLNQKCDGNQDCIDGSDEMDCPSLNRFYHKGSNGQLANFVYANAKTYTWAIQTPDGTNANVELNNFNTEFNADIATVYVGSLNPTGAKVVARLSGQQGTKQYRSYNNLMVIVFSTDNVVTASGFTGTYGSFASSTGLYEELTATNEEKQYTIDRFQFAGINAFLGQKDYVIVISAQDKYQRGQLITVEVDALSLNQGDSVMIFDGDSASDKLLGTLCKECKNYYTFHSTGNAISIFIRTGEELSTTTNFIITYKQGCTFTSNGKWGELFTPGYNGMINYPNFLTCEWILNVDEPIALYFDSDLQLSDEDSNRRNNADLLEIYDNNVPLHSGMGFNTTQLRSQTIIAPTGKVVLRFKSSSIRSERGFKATWSKGCPDPMFDTNTLLSSPQALTYYKASMTLTCKPGYSFQQQQLPNNPSSVTLTCGYAGLWENYLQVPRCTPNYCGDVPNINNGYIESSTGSTFGHTATYQCFTGSAISGSNTITCQSNGQWSSPPQCIAASCPANTINTAIVDGTGEIVDGNGVEIGTIYRYRCDDGYELVGIPTVHCNTQGQWSNAKPTCTLLKCQLPEIPNGQYSNRSPNDLVDYMTNVNVLCNNGYTLENPAVNFVRCEANRTVSTMPNCTNENECTSSSPCINGICHDTVGSFYCTCSPGYRLESNQRTCTDINECTDDIDMCDGGCINQNPGYQCTCNLPYVLYTADGTSGLNIPTVETGALSTDTYHINHSCVLMSCPKPKSTILHGHLLTQRENHLYGDWIEYQCDIGFHPRRSLIQCQQNGWSSTPPECTSRTCRTPSLIGLENPPTLNGTNNYGDRLTLSCTQAGGAINFDQYKFCTYNKVTDEYEYAGSPYECGEVDCGNPQVYPGTNYNVLTGITKFGDSFQFTCSPGNSRSGLSQTEQDTTVRCLQLGYWDFGSLACFGQSCADPGLPLGGNIVANEGSFGDQTTVTYVCDRQGYVISGAPQNITCQGTTWSSSNAPVCVDNTDPVFPDCPAQAIVVRRNELLSTYLPTLNPTDNTAIKSFTWTPVNAYTTYVVANDLNVVFRAEDFNSNTATCTIQIIIRDETPPTITCPILQIITLATPASTQTYQLTRNLFLISDDKDTSPSFNIIPSNIQDTFTAADLYKTFTYTAQASDSSGNRATCRGQIFVTAEVCSELSFPDPLSSSKTCTFDQGTNTRSCTVTCDPGYVLYTSTAGYPTAQRTTTTFTCNKNVVSPDWTPARISACIKDEKVPILTCPNSIEVILGGSDTRTLVSSNFQPTVLDASLTTLSYNPESLALSTGDRYQPRTVTITATDSASLQSQCQFQAVVKPPPCHPDSYPDPSQGQKNCVPVSINDAVTGYSCTVTCNAGYLIRNQGVTKTVTCSNGFAWAEENVITACIRDSTPPDLQCPNSLTLTLGNIDDVLNENFVSNAQYNPIRNQDIGMPSGTPPTLNYSPQSRTFTSTSVNASPFRVTVQSVDLAGNAATCSFFVSVVSADCSYFKLPNINNGVKTCTRVVNQSGPDGYSCTLQCNLGYTFPITGVNQITATCNDGGSFTSNHEITNCVSQTAGIEEQVFTGILRYTYEATDGYTDIPTGCLSYYEEVYKSRTSDFIAQQTQLQNICKAAHTFDNTFSFKFQPSSTVGELLTTSGGSNRNRVQLTYTYNMTATLADSYVKCENTIESNINNGNYALEAGIATVTTYNGVVCPPIAHVDNVILVNGRSACPANFFKTVTSCAPCPAGTVRPLTATDDRCLACPVGQYRDLSSAVCTSCPNDQITYLAGSRSISDCVAPCTGGTISATGYAPCFACAKGYYRTSSTTCTACGSGTSTQGTGSTSSAACSTSYAYALTEKCPLGTSRSDATGTCELCDYGTYGVYNTAQFENRCTSCGNLRSTFVRGATAVSMCFDKCPDGYESKSPNGLSPCFACGIGKYFNTNTRACVDCAVGSTTSKVASIGPGACITITAIRERCSRGTYRDTGTGNCIACAIGSYSTVEDSSSCSQCSAGFSTYMVGAYNSDMCQRKCEPGFYSTTGLSPCSPCGADKYSTAYGSTSCLDCNASQTTLTNTASDCINKCVAGQFSYAGHVGVTGNACRSCPINFFQPNVGSTSCQQCDPNTRYSNNGGLTSSSQCLDAATLCQGKCQNSGVCNIENNSFKCACEPGYEGDRCQTITNTCASSPCYNGGQCTIAVGSTLGYTCNCPTLASGAALATGERCETLVKQCKTDPNDPTCLNAGDCINRYTSPGYQCLCRDGYDGDRNGEYNRCRNKADVCNPNPCTAVNTVQCLDVSNGENLRYYCQCKPGFEGTKCEINTNECDSNPCVNGGTCVDQINSFRCNCPNYFEGTFCETYVNPCQTKSCGANTQAKCIDIYSDCQPLCVCSPGYAYGLYVEYDIKTNMAPNDRDSFNPITVNDVHECREACTAANANCVSFTYSTATKNCYLWQPSNVGTLENVNGLNTYMKHSEYKEDDFWTMKYDLNTPVSSSLSDSERLNNLNDLGLNICGGTAPIEVRCCPVDEDCLDNSQLPPFICFPISSGNPGVQTTNNPVDYSVQFRCAASRVFLDNTCVQKNDYCLSTPCVNGAQCSNVFGGYFCSCRSGYTGKNCQTDIDNCADEPCQNGGTCTDLVNNYQCTCAEGYLGPNCNSLKNYCSDPSPVNCNNGQCRSIEATGYVCECFMGYTGASCQNQIDFCSSTPCIHGSTCRPQLNGYTCDCKPGWEGQNCETMTLACSNPVSGGQCRETCNDIFTDYICKCPANTYGRNCENMPTPCATYNKCQNNAVCSYSSPTMTCNCPTRWTGDGCHVLRDLCGSDNPCKNEGECSVTQNGYSCNCKPGYTGQDCSTEINECLGKTCPGGGQCFDAIGKYYCRCPLKKTGTNCGRDFDPNYDLYFNHPLGKGFAWIPYFVQVPDVNAMSITAWVRYARDGGTGIFLTMFIGDRLNAATKVLEFYENGVKVYVDNGPVMLTYERNVHLNDGNWHFVTLNLNMTTGTMVLLLDTIKHKTVTNSGFSLTDLKVNNGFRMWVALGCEFDNEQSMCSGSNSFHGYLSQINMYRRELTFVNPEPNKPGEISYNFAVPRFIFEDNQQLSNVVLVWNEYELESGVMRIVPSQAQSDKCGKLGRNPPCSFFAGQSRPAVEDCPADFSVYSVERIITVSWGAPRFLGNSIVSSPSQLPGAAYTWGAYPVTYVATDAAGNKAFCSFKFYVTSNQCDAPPNPVGGYQTNSTEMNRSGRTIHCYNSNSNTNPQKFYYIDREHPDLFTCGPSGSWNIEKPFNHYRYPSCGEIRAKPRKNIVLRIYYKPTTVACNAIEDNLKVLIKQTFTTLQNIFVGEDLCRVANCDDIQINITCVERSRRKRQTTLSELQATVNLLNAPATTMLDGETVTIEDFIILFSLSNNTFDYSEEIPNAEIDMLNFNIDGTFVCPVLEVLRDGDCVECGPGNYYRVLDNGEAICEDCALGYYQDSSRQSVCKPCPSGQTTEMTGEFDPNMCKDSCSPGYYFDNDVNRCVACGIGYYQNEAGQFYCKHCGASFTTENEASTSITQCSSQCQSGEQLSGPNNCTKCPIGTYRNSSESRVCVPCPTGFVTATIGAPSADYCTIRACEAGNYRMQDNTCSPCPLNTYQPDRLQDSCIPCGSPSMYHTESTGSTSKDQCLFYCPSGQEVDGTEQCKLCERDHYKDNNENIQGSCTPCQGNRRTNRTGAESANECTIYKCLVGQYPNSLNTGCLPCELGSYQDVPESTGCKQCPQSPFPQSTRDTGADGVEDCEVYCNSGYERLNAACVPCGLGKYKDNGAGLFSMCTDCDPLYTTAGEASTSSSSCSIRTCQVGTYRNADDTGCIDCPIGQYQPNEYQTQCLNCPTGTSTMNTRSNSSNDCLMYCPSGQQMTSNGCQSCPRGYYRDENDGLFLPCKMCDIEFITPGVGAISENQCIVGNCSAGFKLKTDNTCEICPKGSYSANKWLTTCTLCGQHLTTENAGAVSPDLCILECEPGYEDVGSTCVKCSRGFYKEEKAAAACKPCDGNFTTETTGAISSAACTIPACSKGYYLDRSGGLICRPCPYDTYQDQVWQEQCKPCNPNLVTLTMAATQSTQCVSDCVSGQEYNSLTGRCDLCPVGYYRNRDVRSQTKCQLCNLNYITDGEGATSDARCTIANCSTAGTYRDTASNTCRSCPVGTYNAQKWQIACTPCPSGESTASTGSTSQASCKRVCPLGQFVNNNNQCQQCPIGYYRDTATSDTCTKCQNGLLTANQGATSPDACTLSPCVAGERYILAEEQCKKCDIGTYQQFSGRFACIDCPFTIKYTPTIGSTSVDNCRSPCTVGQQFDENRALCVPCPSGTFQQNPFEFSCTLCPTDQPYSIVGATSSAQCQRSPCEAGQEYRNGVCSDCQRGYYQPNAFELTCLQCPENRPSSPPGATSQSQCQNYCDAATDCSTNATCTVDNSNSRGYRCACFPNYDDISVGTAGNTCIHKCDRGYCKNGATCQRETIVSCSCTDFYEGNTCAQRINAEDRSDNTMDIVIPVSIAAGGLILLLILLAVFCLCWRASQRAGKQSRNYSEFNGERIEKASLHSYGYGPYNAGPPQRLMMAPYGEMVYDNSAYRPDLDQNIESAVYQA
ncbi:uncharacterized protein LOC128206514 isoform X2 [Mya arenaria]|uniref:uncharacterized protein LOC128206514 isoform X2 n=1 Tax=Mya arenaria TaxID=6604 RepID=UPI0022E44958|nr:uncharacterized protein LOC128206514 isoform X2 [Mya arenaria]